MFRHAIAPGLRIALAAGGTLALVAATPSAAEGPASSGATAPSSAAAPSSTAPAPAALPTVRIRSQRSTATVGRSVVYRGVVRGSTQRRAVRLQLRRGGRWVTVDRTRTTAKGAFRLSATLTRPGTWRARVAVAHHGRPLARTRTVRRVQGFRRVSASYYGPGLYGSALACGGTLSPGQIGVANKSLPCGTKITLRHGGRTVTARVIDRGPYVAGRELDLTEATKQRLGFGSTGTVLMNR